MKFILHVPVEVVADSPEAAKALLKKRSKLMEDEGEHDLLGSYTVRLDGPATVSDVRGPKTKTPDV